MRTHSPEYGLAAFLLIAAQGVVVGAAAQEPVAPEPTLEQRLQRIENALSNQGLLQMLQQLESLQLEISRLQGAVEVQTHTLEQLKKRQRDMYADMDRRLQRVESPDAPPGTDAPPLQTLAPLSNAGIAGSAQGEETSLTLELVNRTPASGAAGLEDIAPLAAAPEQPSALAPAQDGPVAAAAAGLPAPTAMADASATGPDQQATGAETPATALAPLDPEQPGGVPPQPGLDPSPTPEQADTQTAADLPAFGQQDPALIQEEYRQAFNLLKQARYNEAVLALRGFLTRYPDSEPAANARFWLAEAYYVNSLFEQALAEYSALVQQYPDSPKQTQAQLKAAFCQHELGQVEPAVQQLEALILQHPGTTAASLAQDRLAQIATEAVPEQNITPAR
ncbi:MAG: tol-pal system protein YbgF [Gammaproteobacteria bacterium]|nr:tol-pal system protein YbgF [Gammaproteobacteria bacterium]